VTYGDIFTRKSVICRTGGNANGVPRSGCYAGRVDMVMVIVEPQLEAVFPPGGWRMLHGIVHGAQGAVRLE
jgi:hypothetical protein